MVNVKTALFLLPLATYVRGRPIDLDLTAQDIEDPTVCSIENLAGCDDEDLAGRGIHTLAARGDEGLVSQSDDGRGRSYSSASVSDNRLVTRGGIAGIANLAIKERGLLGDVEGVIKGGAKKIDPKNKPEKSFADPRKKAQPGYTGSKATDEIGRSHSGAKVEPHDGIGRSHAGASVGPASKPNSLPHAFTPKEHMQGQDPGRHPSPFSNIGREKVPKGRKSDSSHGATDSKSSDSKHSGSTVDCPACGEGLKFNFGK